MMRTKILPFIGLALLGACFLYSAGRMVKLAMRERDPSITTIRLAHWQLEEGVKEAFDEIIAAYEKLHPHVRVEQILLPERAYRAWMTTRLVGGNAPDLIAINPTVSDERLARYFVPISAEVDQPNPYNAGTGLEGVPWKDTFLDGLENAQGLTTLFDYYAVPLTVITVRLFYNAELYRKVTGSDRPPKTFRDLARVFDAVKDYNRRTGANLVAVAGSKYNGPLSMDLFFQNQTQKLTLELDQDRVLRPPAPPYKAYYQGKLRLDDPAVLSGLQLLEELSGNMQPGFLQQQREDASFDFSQGRALMIVTGSWDIKSLQAESPFKIAVCDLPIPEPDDPTYGPHVLGPTSEGNSATVTAVGMTRQSPHQKVALDFMRFLTSQASNRTFSAASNWLPSVVGVEVTESVRPFLNRTEGYTTGFTLRSTGGAEVRRIFDNSVYLLGEVNGGVDAFRRIFEAEFPAALLDDTKRTLKNAHRVIARNDTTVGALRVLEAQGQAQAAAKRRQLDELQNRQELDFYSRRYILDQFQKKKGPR